MMTTHSDIEQYRWILDRTVESVKSVDGKNGVTTAILAGLAAILFSNDNFSSSVFAALSGKSNTMCLVMLAGILISTALVIFSLFASLIPRTKCEGDSSLYFGTIAKHKDFLSYKRELVSQDYSIEDDLVNQIYINSKICRTKMRWHSVASFSTYLLILFIAGFSICYVIGV
ncbi:MULTISPECIES: Pycsar system effector family protein [Gordonibacter]|uniref:DUF5706 domain-containing protein n=1 Tax=Gordonibacter faecis TaxID=3047475 RepID=A0ABT7DQZ8_9ACTN|nr:MULTISPECIES: Pycsar system effector family protein [unclassified Gordonibacter]MDJ1651662.1 DUF5706 domain-containing protein [Gordonibacter sp. KGMB12511]HIW77086.1 hypothetical protein [Candidatus Gordonibacter avicola]